MVTSTSTPLPTEVDAQGWTKKYQRENAKARYRRRGLPIPEWLTTPAAAAAHDREQPKLRPCLQCGTLRKSTKANRIHYACSRSEV